MIFNPQNKLKKDGFFAVPENAIATAHPCLDKNVIKEFWNNFTFGTSRLEISKCEEFVFRIGETNGLPPEDFDYTINVDNFGICIRAASEKELVRGFMTLLDMIEATDADNRLDTVIPCVEICDRALVKKRMVHFCIFPETELWELQRFVRMCGALKFTHIVLEFWGMLKYDCMKELSWAHAYSKDDIRPTIREARELGLEIIPMFNQWGHATASRVLHGKHVVLDQNPALQTYFSEDGWCWDISKPKVRELLRKIRKELIELCGEGEYFHIGCDEAYNFEFSKENMDFICDFINEVSSEMKTSGRRVIAWGDMFLFKHPDYSPNNVYCCNAPTHEAERYMLDHLDKSVIVADWQYDATYAPVETASVFAREDFDCLLCPWDRGRKEMKAVMTTVKEMSLLGFLHTTWHTLSRGMPYVLIAALSGYEEIGIRGTSALSTKTAALIRKVMPSGGDYSKSGWSKIQIHTLW